MRSIYVVSLALLILMGVFLANFWSFQEQEPSILHDQAAPFESLLPQESDALVETPAESAPLCAQQVPAWDANPTQQPIPEPSPSPVPEPSPSPVPEQTPSPVPEQSPSPVPESSLSPIPEPDVLTSEPPSVALVPPPPVQVINITENAETATPVSVSAPYIYFYTGVPVQSVPAVPMYSAVVYPNVYIPAASTTMVSMSTAFVSTTPVFLTSTPTVQSHGVPVFVPRVVPSRVGSSKWVYPNGVVIKPKVYYPQQPLRNALRGVTP